MTQTRTFKSGEILSDEDRTKLSPADRKRYDLEQKIRGLMKLADDERASEGERENATRMIAKLITRHQIDLALLREQETGKASGPVKIVRFEVGVSNKLGLGGVRCRVLHRAVISPLGGHSVFFHSSGQSSKVDARLEIYLPEDVVDFAKMLIASLTLQVETSMKVAVTRFVRELRMQYVSKNYETRETAKFRKGYLLSWGSTVGRRIAEGRQEAREEAQRFTGKELAVLDTSNLAKRASEEWNEANGFKIGKARAVVVSRTGQMAGVQDGRRAQLGINEVGGSRRSLVG
jgi:hypothetical protein